MADRAFEFQADLPLRAVKHAVYASAARTATPTAFEVEVDGHRGVEVYINSTAVTATPSVVATIYRYDELSGAYVSVLASAAIATVTTTRLKVAPGLVPSANAVASDFIGNKLKIELVHGDADSITYTVDLVLHP
jgi:hypothetical protein